MNPFPFPQAVKRSREKSKQQAKETQGRVDKLKAENEKLRHDIRRVANNMQTLKDLFLNATSAKKESIDIDEVRRLLEEVDTIEVAESEESSESEELDSEDEED